MAEPSTKYVKLPGHGRRGSAIVSFARNRLWLGDDHLLSVDFTVASEEYKRFYFRDIEAFIIRRTGGRAAYNWVFSILLLLTAGPFFLGWRSDGEGGLLIGAIGFTVFWSIFILVNSLRGSTCKTHIRTAVQLEEMPSLGRLPVAQRVLSRIQPLIVEAQGAATPEELVGAPWMVATSATPLVHGAKLKPEKTNSVVMHRWLFGVLVLEAFLVAIAFLVFQTPMTVFSMLAMLSGAILSVVAVMRQSDSTLPGFLRLMAKLALGYYVLKCLVGFIFMMMFAVRNPGTPMLTGLEMIGEPGFSETAAIMAVLGGIIGVVGVIALVSAKPTAPVQPGG